MISLGWILRLMEQTYSIWLLLVSFLKLRWVCGVWKIYDHCTIASHVIIRMNGKINCVQCIIERALSKSRFWKIIISDECIIELSCIVHVMRSERSKLLSNNDTKETDQIIATEDWRVIVALFYAFVPLTMWWRSTTSMTISFYCFYSASIAISNTIESDFELTG